MRSNRKIGLLIGGFIIVFVICYQLAFSKTHLLNKEVGQLEENQIGVSELGVLNHQLSLKERMVDSVLDRHNLKRTSIQNGLLSYLNARKENSSIQIISFDEPHRFQQQNGVTVSYSFQLTGDYNDLLELVYGLEQDYSFGEVKHVSFEKKRDYRARRDYLEGKIIIVNYVISNKNNSY